MVRKLTIRERHRVNASPREGERQSWVEWQVVEGRKVLSRHDFKEQAERAMIRATIKLKTEYVYPPIPIRSMDWSAIDDSTYEPGSPIGTGRTEQEAIEDLIDQLVEMES